MNEENTSPKRPQYLDKFQLLNKSEQVLFQRLRETAPMYLVFSQVSMSQLFHIRSFRTGGFMQIGEIGRKSVDFLLCRQDTSIVLAIELNGPTHEREEQKYRDEKKRIALEEAGIPLLVIDPAAIPDIQELKIQMAELVVERRAHEAEKKERIAHNAARKTERAEATKATTNEPTKKKFWFKRKTKSP